MLIGVYHTWLVVSNIVYVQMGGKKPPTRSVKETFVSEKSVLFP